MGLEQSHGGEDEGDVVDVGDGLGPVHAGRARVDSDADCEEEGVVDGLGHGGGVIWGIEAPESAGEGGGDGGGVDWWSGGEVRWGKGLDPLVAEESDGGGVVDGDDRVHEGGNGDCVFSGGLVGGEEGVCGLPRPEEDCVGGEGLRVGGVGFDDGEFVAGDFEEELVVDRRVYYPEQVGFSICDVETVPCTRREEPLEGKLQK
ncbi:unnamed protein product [Linum trigynum]|uniref:Uncharacterized protein n=1 Tax=Linum trigynum TaxID=586398 RepID=A0AAV2ENY3_9ROSI